jgi:hypothetical protein
MGNVDMIPLSRVKKLNNTKETLDGERIYYCNLKDKDEGIFDIYLVNGFHDLTEQYKTFLEDVNTYISIMNIFILVSMDDITERVAPSGWTALIVDYEVIISIDKIKMLIQQQKDIFQYLNGGNFTTNKGICYLIFDVRNQCDAFIGTLIETYLAQKGMKSCVLFSQNPYGDILETAVPFEKI